VPKKGPTRAELALVRQALRQDWPTPTHVKTKILQRLIDYLDRECDEGATAPDRTVISAARTLAAFYSLSLRQQCLDLEREKFAAGKSGDSDLLAAIREAELIVAKRNGPAGPAPGGLPG